MRVVNFMEIDSKSLIYLVHSRTEATLYYQQGWDYREPEPLRKALVDRGRHYISWCASSEENLQIGRVRLRYVPLIVYFSLIISPHNPYGD